MALPPCFEVLDAGYFNSVIGQIYGATNPLELQTIVNQVYGDIALLNSTIESQLVYLNPILALITAPANPSEAVTWIENFITGFLQPYVLPITKYASQLAALTSEVATMTTAIESVASGKGWTINIPPVTAFCSI